MRWITHGGLVLASVALHACSCGSDIKVADGQNAAPTAIITAPEDEAVFAEFETIEFFGTVADGNGLDDIQSVVWSSDVVGEMAVVEPDNAGTVRHNQTLPAGTHTVSLTATDTDGDVAIDAITVIVQPQAQMPTVVINQPQNLAIN